MMLQLIRGFRWNLLLLALAVVSLGSGCQSLSQHRSGHQLPETLLTHESMPRELDKVILPPYVIEPPDVLVIEGIHLVPRATYGLRTGDVVSIRAQETVDESPYRLRRGDLVGIEALETIGDLIRAGDALLIQVQGTPPGAPINGAATVEPDGTIDLDAIRILASMNATGPAGDQNIILDTLYGSVTVAGLTLDEAKAAIRQHLARLRDPVVFLFSLRKAPPQGISNAFVIEPDGTVNLDQQVGTPPDAANGMANQVAQLRFGSLALAGKTRDEASQAIREHVQDALPAPRVTVTVLRMAPPQWIGGAFQIEPEGTVNLDAPLNIQAGPPVGMEQLLPGEVPVLNVITRYGSVPIAGNTKQQAEQRIAQHLQALLREPQVSVAILRMAGLQQIAGQHLVTPDGTVTLGSFGSVSVVGNTLAEAKWAIESHLSQELEQPEVAVDVFAYNSKVYYVVFQGAGTGDTVYKLPVTGNDTVIDAIAGIGGFQFVSSKKMWIARPTPHDGSVQILPVDWQAISAQGAVATNYQLMPGDRVFIAEDKLIALDTGVAKLLAPFERVMGFSTLGVNTVSRFSGRVLQGGGLRGFWGGGGGF